MIARHPGARVRRTRCQTRNRRRNCDSYAPTPAAAIVRIQWAGHGVSDRGERQRYALVPVRRRDHGSARDVRRIEPEPVNPVPNPLRVMDGQGGMVSTMTTATLSDHIVRSRVATQTN